MTRDAEIAAFLAAQGWAGARRTPLAGDASARRYERLAAPGRGAVLMDMPPASGLDARPFLAVTAWLRRGGLSAPEVLGADPARGLVLLEDLGDDLFARLCDARPAPRARALRRRRRPARRPAAPPAAGGGGRLGTAALRPRLPHARGAARARVVPARRHRPARSPRTSPPSTRRWRPPPSPRCSPRPRSRCCATTTPRTCSGCPTAPGTRGSACSTTRTCCSAIPPTTSSRCSRTPAATPPRRCAPRCGRATSPRSGAEPEAFAHAAAVLAAQRNLKIVGLFTRLARRDGKPRYLGHLPRVWDHLRRDLRHPALAPLRAFVARHLPPPEATVRARIEAAA